MKLTPLKLVTIVAEQILEDRLVETLKQLGATGYTSSSSHGEGSRGTHVGEIPGDNIRIETIVSHTVAEKIMNHLAAEYFHNFAVICYITDVQVMRSEKYISNTVPS